MESLGDLRIKNWGLWLVFGILLIVVGFVLLASPIVGSLASVAVFGSLLLASGVIHIITAILDRKSNHMWLHLIIAALTIIVGLLMLFNPGVTIMTLTLLIAVLFLSNGLFRIIGGLVSRFKGWGWYILNGLISLLLGLLILFHWPNSSLWVIGLFLGIDFIFAGWSLMMIALFVKRKSLLA